MTDFVEIGNTSHGLFVVLQNRKKVIAYFESESVGTR